MKGVHMIEATTTSDYISGQPLKNPGWYNALTLKERLASPVHEPQEDTCSTEHALYRLKRWKGQSPFDKDTCFTERLAADNITEDELFSILKETAQNLQKRIVLLPGWLQEIDAALDDSALSDISQLLASSGLTDEQIIPLKKLFQQSVLALVQPLIAQGIKGLQTGIDDLFQKYGAPPFRRDLILAIWLENLPHHLLHRLNRTFILELHVARLEKRLEGHTPEERFQDFLQQISHGDKRRSFLEEYASLARLVMKFIDNWVNYGKEFFEHLCSDWSTIRENIFAGVDPGMLVEAKSGMGDHHKSGRSTIVLRFASGLQLVYKPRSVAVDQHFQDLLTWLNQHGQSLHLKTIKIIRKETYGWSEFVQAEGCQSREEVKRFYERQGAYLALLYVLNATDLHYENLIAAGEMPVLIDLESLFHPHLPVPHSDLPNTGIWEQMSSSVLRIGLLPMRVWGNAHSRGVDLSGLGGLGGQQTPGPVLQFTAHGTDQMHVIRQHAEIPAQNNRPRIQGKDVDIFDYWNDLSSGFVQMYRFLEHQKLALLSGPLKAFEHDQVRVIVRPTQAYAMLLHESYHPDFLRNTLDRDSFFDRLWQRVPEQPFLKKVIPAEQEDLHDGDIPLFTTTPSTRDIYSSKGTCIPAFCSVPGIEPVKERLQNLCDGDLERQIWFIQASFAAASLSQKHSHKTSTRTLSASPSSSVSQEELLRAACKIGDRLAELAFLAKQEAQWLCLSLVNEQEWRILPAGIDLYNGVTGIAFFLAYLGAITGKTIYRTLAEDAVRNVQGQLKAMQQSISTVGAFSGWGTIIYLYTHLGVLWNDPHFLQLAEEAVELSLDQIEDDTMLDFMAGGAGYIAALLCLYSVQPSQPVLSAALRAGKHLISNLQLLKPGDAPQRGIAATSPLTGLSHGMAGLALSLLRLAYVSGEASYQQAAMTAIEYERSVFSSEKQNWPDFRDISAVANTTQVPHEHDKDGQEFMTTWCHGAAGIGLARLASCKYIDDAQIREEIRIALDTTLREGFGWCHSLCHGDMGNLDVFLTASYVLDDPSYKEHTQHLLAKILQSMEEQGYVTGAPFGMEVPGLMVGIAGIGYEFLRLATPDRVPSVLTLEPPVPQGEGV
jgi:type 2 lantibiotic biosynthesis protein LanM